MGWSRHHKTGLIHYAPQHSFRGYTLLTTNRGGTHANLIDMEGKVCHRWQAPEGINYAYLLANGNLLLRTASNGRATEGHPAPPGAVADAVLELDWDSNVVWETRLPLLHHDFERLPNGNTLLLCWEPMPAELTPKVLGGFSVADDPCQMLGDVVKEVSSSGALVYEWKSWEYLDLEEDIICPLEGRKEFTHQNALSVTEDGDLLVSYRQTSTIGIVDKSTGVFKWKWGPGFLSHQHNPTYLDNGNVLVFDNGPHRRGVSYSRIIEINPSDDEIIWEYLGDPPISFFSYHISGCERLSNGNTLITEGAPGRIFEITRGKEIVWEYINPFTSEKGSDASASPGIYPNAVFRAHRYSPDYSGLEGRDLDPDRYRLLNSLYS